MLCLLVSLPLSIKQGVESLRSTDGQNHSNNHFRSGVHLQVPHHQDGDNGKSPVTHTCNCRISIGCADCNFRVEAFPCASSVLSPEVRRRLTLEDEDEEEECAVNLGDNERNVDEYSVKSDDCEAEKHCTNAQLDRHIR